MKSIPRHGRPIVATLCKRLAPSSKTKEPAAPSTWHGNLTRHVRSSLGVGGSLFITSLLTLPAQAQLDTNGNGMSDVWERHYNQGALFAQSLIAAADPDGDGWTNLEESIAGTNPFHGNPPEGMVATYVTHLKDQEEVPSGRNIDLAVISWDTLPGKQYTLLYSPDLTHTSWLPVDVPYTGDGMPEAITITLTDSGGLSPQRLFWRVKVEDSQIDTDEDGLTLHEEFLLGSNPYLSDTSGDGIPDGWLASHGLNPSENHASILFSGHEISVVEAYGLGVQAYPDATPDDLDGDGLPNKIDSVPDDRHINWEKSAEVRYVWVEQVTKTGATAMSRHGHILFPAYNNGNDTIAEHQILWDSGSSEWLDLPEHNVWSNSGLYITAPGIGDFDQPWLEILDMNDDGVVIGISNYGAFASAGFFGVQAAMKWERNEESSNQYEKPTYLVSSAGSGGNSLVDSLITGNIRIAETGALSAACAYWNANTSESSYKWYVKDLELGQHSNTMDEWKTFPDTGTYQAQAILDSNTGLFSEYTANPGMAILHYRNHGESESLHGLLPNPSSEIIATDIAKTPLGSGSPAGRVWFSVSQTAGDSVFLEKSSGGSGPSRWHKPPSMSEGAIRLNARGEAITETKVWRNGNYTEINELATMPENVAIEKLIDLSSNGIILAQVTDNGVPKTGLLVPASIVPDWNRDGKIDVNDYGKVTPENPWRFWVNDDDDAGDVEGNDIPQGYTSSDTNSKNSRVDGIRDLVDFFPIFLDIQSMLEIYPGNKYRYRLTHPHPSDNPALRVVLVPQLTPQNSDHHLRNLQFSYSQLQAAESRAIHHTGLLLEYALGGPPMMLDTLREGQGILIVEGVKNSSEPIILKVERMSDNTTITEIPFHVRIEGVENMFRWKYVPPGNAMLQKTDMPADPPNWPDADRNNKHFIFVHGYNVDENQSRGWASEIFKRMFWSGSNAMFSAFAWKGHESQIPFVNLTPNYQVNLRNAFATAKSFQEFHDHLSGDKTVAAHSMGNIVVGLAMHDHEVRPANYIMLNAAAAKECYDASEVKTGQDPADEQELNMVHQAWLSYPRAVRASEWHAMPNSIWPVGDDRRKLTWKNRLRGVIVNDGHTKVYNFYSSGEEVLNNPLANDPFYSPEFPNITIPAWAKSNKVWAMQEKKKGYGLTGMVLTSNYGGWRPNLDPYNADLHVEVPGTPPYNRRMKTAAELPNPLTNQWLLERTLNPMSPFFNRDNHADLYDNQTGAGTPGSNYARDNRDLLISEMIPCTTYAAGRNALGVLPLSQNIDLNIQMKTDPNMWPLSNENDNDAEPNQAASRPWLHSDIRNKAFTHNWKAYHKFVEIGELNQ